VNQLGALRDSFVGRASTVSERVRTWCEPHFTGIVAVAAFLIYAATGAYGGQSIDVGAAEEPAWALATLGTLDLSQVAHHDLPFYFAHGSGLFSDRFPGAIFFLVPGYWLADLFGVHEFSTIPGVLSAAGFAAATVGIMSAVFSRVLATGQARIATLFFAFGTGTWTISGHAPWSHTIGQFFVALTLLALSRERDRLGALTAGFLTLTRPVEAIAVVVLGATLAWLRKSWQTLIWFAMLVVPGVALLFTYNGLMFDHWGPSNGHELGGEIDFSPTDLPVNVLGTLFAPWRGLLFYYPFLVLVPVAFKAAWQAARDWERAAFLAGIFELLAQLALNRYSGGDTFFGNRLVIEPLTFAAPVLARSVVCVMQGRRHAFMAALLTAGVFIHAFGATVPPF